METKYLLESFNKENKKADLTDFAKKLSKIFPSIEVEELPMIDTKMGGMISNPALITFYPFGENKSLTVIYHLNTVFGSYCKNLKDATQNPRTIERIEIIPKHMDTASQMKLEKLLALYK